MKQGNFFQRHPGADFYSLFWLLVFLALAGLGRFFPPLWIPALVALVYLLFRLFSKNAERRQMENARFLADSGAAMLFRQPLIPGVNSPEENVRATADFIRSLGRPELQLQLIPYHRMGTSKYAALDIPYTLEEMKPMTGEEAEAVRALYESCGIICTISK